MSRWLPVVLVSVAALPLALGVAAGLARWRGWRRSLTEVGMVVGTLPWLWMTLTPVPVVPGVTYVWLVPLTDLANVVASGDPGYVVVQVGGNLLVFAAFGLLAPLRWGWGPGRVTLVAALGSLTIETLQLLLPIGRVASVDDVLVNAAGAGLAALLVRAVARGGG